MAPLDENYTDNTPFFQMLARMMKAAGKRAAHADPGDLAQLVAIRDDLDAAIVAAVRGLRGAGITWRSIGEATGTSKEAAVQKWAHRV